MQVNRLFEIIYILLERKTVTAAQLASKFEVSTRTIYRDIETLSQAGIPVYMSKGSKGGISLLPEFILNKAVLTSQEKADILSAMKAVSAVNFTKNDSALGKLDSMLGSSASDWIEVDFSAWGNTENEAENFRNLKSAILEKLEVQFTYASGKMQKTSRRVMPLKLVFKGAAWYLYAFCKKRSDYRFFKLRRIDSLCVCEEHFEMNAPVTTLLRMPDKKPMVKAVLQISGRMAFRVCDEISDYSEDENGNFLCQVFLPDIKTVCDYAASYGENCLIIEPKAAYDELRRRIRKMSEIYK
ncbi:MAG: YafY family protein [Oscillospiraceae bacterium]|nr:YafY family protein [Oscillospiraceae bacterium]